MTRFAMTVDVDRCTGCYACFLACRDEFTGNDYPPHSAAQPSQAQSWIRVEETERGNFPKLKISYTPVMCQQCAEAPCIDAASDGAVYRRDDGIVIIDPERAAGQKAIVDACPYDVVFWNEEKDIAQKCTFCAHLEGAEPRCVETCPVGALQFGDLDDPDSAVARQQASGESEFLHPELGLDPLVAYTGLPKKFVAGEVVFRGGDEEECAPGVTVVLKGAADERSSVTSFFGDFEFDGLAADTNYTLIVDHEGYTPVELALTTKSDLNLGVIELK
jgi:Fe-S-cluster-containing dehydrogenase component